MNISFLKETYNYLILLLISAVLLTSGCEKTNFDKDKLKCEVKTVEGSPISVVGKWKFVKGKRVFYSPKTYDYSCQSIIYEFSSEGILTVSGNAEPEIGYSNGKYEYFFQKNSTDLDAQLSYSIIIEGKSIPSEIVNNQLEINDSSLDGDILYLVRIE